MSGLWNTNKSYSKAVAEYAAAPVTALGAALGKGATATTITTTTTYAVGAGTTATTTTVTTASVGLAGAAVAVAGGLALGTAAGQLINAGISFFWDPEPVDTEMKSFQSVSDKEIDSFINEVLSSCEFRNVFGDRVLTCRDIIESDQVFNGSGTAVIRFARVGIRALVNVLRGAAFGTAGDKREVRRAGKAVQSDIEEYINAIRNLAHTLEGHSEIMESLPSVSLSSYLQFIDDHDRRGDLAIPPMESVLINKIGEFSKVSFREDFGQRVAKWVAEGPDEQEVATFRNAPDQNLNVIEILLGGIVWCWSDLDITKSDYLRK